MTQISDVVPSAQGLGIAGHDFRGSPDALAAEFAQLGVDKLDYWPSNRGALPLDDYRELLDRHGLTAYTVNQDTSRGRFGAPALERFAADATRTAIEEAVALEAPYVQLYLAPPPPERVAERVDDLARSLTPLAREAEAVGVTLVVENNFDHRAEDAARVNVARSPQALGELVEAVGRERLALAFDPVNFVLCDVDPLAAYETLRPYVVNVHLKDCVVLDSVADDGEDRRVLRDGDRRHARSTAVGDGALPWREILAGLATEGFDGWLTLDPYCDPEDVHEWSRRSLANIAALAADKEPTR
ncbi:sugar phosphate isomerase/epimerase [Conexibacter sp. CPCC 206217]|uniref:sugar phosphate isomerase/epimerase family protein n=1 Tax=Conexibacter sp. CPCC 206217 TaxID=3064574 RepID=UPI00272698B7|nr:sugar phosphate isomerase/epimerase family protein [Conexibacter sp. CPCC 206217]MDO8209623.1 sugar phosphate isomerase/epimerase family protein [Conexibacter sp. CPCC 206217]